MENYIYILIGIGWVAYSLYSARQKAIRKQQSRGLPQGGPSHSSPLPIPGNQEGGKSLLDDIIRELTGGEPRPVAQPVNQPVSQHVSQPVVPVKTKRPKAMTELNQPYGSLSEYKFTSSSTTEFPSNDSGNVIKKHPIYQQIKEGNTASGKFDLRQAVIFSELLNPKYF